MVRVCMCTPFSTQDMRYDVVVLINNVVCLFSGIQLVKRDLGH